MPAITQRAVLDALRRYGRNTFADLLTLAAGRWPEERHKKRLWTTLEGLIRTGAVVRQGDGEESYFWAGDVWKKCKGAA